MKKILIILTFAGSIFPQPISSGCRYLLIDYDAVSSSTGGAVVACFNRPGFIIYNPAIGFLLNYPSIYTYYSHKSIDAEDIRVQLFSPLRRFALSVDIYGEFFHEEDMTDEDGKVIGSFSPFSLILHPSLSTLLYPNLYAGLGMKLFMESIGDYTGGGFGTDFGIYYRLKNTGVNFAGVIKDVGKGPKFIEDNTSLPLRFIGGITYSPQNKGGLTISTSYEKYLKDKINKLRFGISYAFYNVLHLRLGFVNTSVGYDTGVVNIKNIGGGIGITSGRFQIDIGFAGLGEVGGKFDVALQYTIVSKERIEVSEIPGISEKEKMTSINFYNNALARAAKGDYEGAVELLDIALIWDPDNTEAAEKIGEYKAKLKQEGLSSLMKEGKTFYNKGNYLDALLIFEKANKLDPSNEEINKCIILARTGLMQHFKKDTLVSKMIEEGNELYVKGEYGAALRKWQEAKEKGADTALINSYIENISMRLISYIAEENKKINSLIDGGKLSAAASRMRRLENKLKDISTLKNCPSRILSIVTEGRNKLEKANKKLKNKVAELNRAGIESYKNGEYVKAEGYFRSVLFVEPNNNIATQYLLKIKQKKRASKEDVSDLYMKGVLAYTAGDYKLAIFYWDEVLKINPNHTTAKKNLKRARKKLITLTEK